MANKPCIDCPFRREGGVMLSSERKEEIAQVLLNDGYFHCHKTLDYSKGKPRENKHSKFCVGAVIRLDNVSDKFANRCVRMAAMCGHFDPDNLKDVEEVCGSYGDFVESFF